MYQDMALVKHKLLMVKSCCTFKVSKKLNVPIKCCEKILTLYIVQKNIQKWKKEKMKWFYFESIFTAHTISGLVSCLFEAKGMLWLLNSN